MLVAVSQQRPHPCSGEGVVRCRLAAATLRPRLPVSHVLVRPQATSSSARAPLARPRWCVLVAIYMLGEIHGFPGTCLQARGGSLPLDAAAGGDAMGLVMGCASLASQTRRYRRAPVSCVRGRSCCRSTNAARSAVRCPDRGPRRCVADGCTGRVHRVQDQGTSSLTRVWGAAPLRECPLT